MIDGFLAALGLPFCVGSSLVSPRAGYSPVEVHGLLAAAAFLAVERGL